MNRKKPYVFITKTPSAMSATPAAAPHAAAVNIRDWLICTVSVIEPGLGAVRVAADFPETPAVAREEFDLADPLRALPRVELRRDHPHRSAVFPGQRLALPRVHQQDV